MGFHILKCSCGPKHYFPQRFIMAIMALMGVLVGYGHRVSLNIAITAMTDKKVSKSKSCPLRNTSFALGHKKIAGGVISWTNQEQNWILSSFYPGYIIGHVPSGLLSDHFGARWILFGGILLSTLVAIITPIAVVNTPWWVIYILRSIMGLGQSVIFTSISVLYAKWIPSAERSVLGAFSFAASSLGVISGNLLTGMLIEAVRDWRVSFYVWGGLGGVWCLILFIYVFSEPVTHPFITTREKEKLGEEIPKSDRKLKTPWGPIFKERAMWALVIGEMGHDFTLFTLVNNFPKYMSDVLHYDLAENSMACSLPYIAQWIGSIIFGRIGDLFIRKKYITKLTCRRIMTTLGMVIPVIFVVLAGYMGCDGTKVTIMFALHLFFKGPVYCSMKINHLDLSVNFAGILMALANGIGATAGWVSPMMINVLAPNNTLEEWRLVYWIVFAISCVSNVIFFFCCKAERQVWDVGPSEMESFLKQKEEAEANKKKEKEAKKAAKEAKKEAKKKADGKEQPTGPSNP